MLFAGARATRFALTALALIALAGCTHTTEVTVRDPGLVGARVEDEWGIAEDLPGDRLPTRVDVVMPHPTGFLIGGPAQRLSLVREESGALRFEAPDTRGHEQGTLVDEGGRVIVPPSYLGADDAARFGPDLRMRYLIEYDTRGRHHGVASIPSFEIWLHTPASNVVSANVHTKPIRPLAVPLLILATVLGGATAGMLASKDHTTRTAGAGVLGGLSLSFGLGGTLLLTVPETNTPLDMDR